MWVLQQKLWNISLFLFLTIKIGDLKFSYIVGKMILKNCCVAVRHLMIQVFKITFNIVFYHLIKVFFFYKKKIPCDQCMKSLIKLEAVISMFLIARGLFAAEIFTIRFTCNSYSVFRTSSAIQIDCHPLYSCLSVAARSSFCI